MCIRDRLVSICFRCVLRGDKLCARLSALRADLLHMKLQRPKQIVRRQSGAGGWSDRFAAVSAARTLLVHHPTELFRGGQEAEKEDGAPVLLSVVMQLLASAASDESSKLRTNGLRGIGELFRCVSAGHLGAP